MTIHHVQILKMTPVPGRPTRMVVIYEHPKDYPDHYVVRACEVRFGALCFDQMCSLFTSPEAAQKFVRDSAPHMLRIQGPGEDPDPVIFEVYA